MAASKPKTAAHWHQAGFSMIEALIASALLAVGLAGAARLASSTLLAGHESRHQHLALGMAQDILECWGVPSAHCQSWFPTLLTAADGSSSLDAQGMRFARSWRISTLWPSPYSFEALPGLQELSVRVQWRPLNASTLSLDALPHERSEVTLITRRASTPTWVGVSLPSIPF